MKTPTFQEQYNKIVNAYYRDELQPMNSCACFIGNLLNKSDKWNSIGGCKGDLNAKDEIFKFYNGKEIYDMEFDFLHHCVNWTYLGYENLEEGLFKAMESTLIMLKEIHESKGEIIPSYDFKKRELVKA